MTHRISFYPVADRNDHPVKAGKRAYLSEPVRLALKYALVAGLWIVGSDLLLTRAEGTDLREAGWNMAKGLAFVAVTGLILYSLAKRMQTRLRKSEEARQAELSEVNRQLQRAKGLQAGLTRANQAALSATDETALCQEISQALVGLGGLRLVWFSWVDETTRRLVPGVWAGESSDYLKDFVCSVDSDDAHGRGPSGRAVREGRIVVCADLLTDPSVQPWRDKVVHYGFRSSACAPIRAGGRRGAITAYSGEPGFFGEEVASLMSRLAADIEHGLGLIATRAEHARVHALLRESESRYRSLFENDHVVMLLIDPATGDIREANPAAVAYYGWDHDTLVHKNVADINQLSSEEIGEELRRAAEGERRFFEFRHRLADGSIRDVEVRTGPVCFGGVRLLYSIVNDVTEKHRTDARLHLMQSVLEAAPSGIVIADVIGRIEWVNPAFVKMTGYSLEEVVGRNPNILRSGRQGPAFYEKLWGTISHGRVWAGELQNQRRDGSIYWEHMVVAPVPTPSGAIGHYVAIKQDISSHKEMEKQVARTQRLESIGLLAGGIAHDLNNVLAPILMAMDLFKIRYPLPADQERLEMIRKSAERGAGIVRQVLTFARGVDGERMRLRPEHLVKEVRNLLFETLPRNIELPIVMEENLPAVVGDATQLHQVLLNLGVNARDAMRQGGVLTFGARREHLAEPLITASGLTVPPGDYLVLFVRDTGSGIPPEVIEHMFEPFYTTKPRGEGTGLGLSTVLGIVRGHGGGLDVVTRLGAGTEFRVLLPAVSDEAPVPPVADALTGIWGGGRTILVADDEEPVRVITGLVLDLHGFVHVDACDGQEAIELMEANPGRFSAVILDQVMPRVNGDEVAARIRTLRPDLPIIFTSGLLTETGATEIHRSPGDLVLGKPFSQGDLLAILGRALGQPDLTGGGLDPLPGR